MMFIQTMQTKYVCIVNHLRFMNLKTTIINICIGFWVLILYCSKSVNAGAPPLSRQVIAAAELSGLFHNIQQPQSPEDRGVYFDTLSQILNETGLSHSMEIIVMPMKRAKMGFLSNKFACYSPGLATFDEPAELKLMDDILVSVPLNKAIVRIVSPKDKPVVRKIEDIGPNDVISMVRGTPLSYQMRKMAKQAGHLIFVNSELENISMLLNGRVNYLFVFYPDVLFAYKKLGIKEHFPYAKQFAPLIIEDNLICHKEYAGAFALINEKIEQYRRNGKLKRLLNDFYMIDSPYLDVVDD